MKKLKNERTVRNKTISIGINSETKTGNNMIKNNCQCLKLIIVFIYKKLNFKRT